MCDSKAISTDIWFIVVCATDGLFLKVVYRDLELMRGEQIEKNNGFVYVPVI